VSHQNLRRGVRRVQGQQISDRGVSDNKGDGEERKDNKCGERLLETALRNKKETLEIGLSFLYPGMPIRGVLLLGGEEGGESYTKRKKKGQMGKGSTVELSLNLTMAPCPGCEHGREKKIKGEVGGPTCAETS